MRTLIAILVVTAISLAGCSDDPAKLVRRAAVGLPIEMRDLVPPDAVALVRFDSLDDMTRCLADAVLALDPDARTSRDAFEILLSAGFSGPEDGIDRKRPIAIAFSFPQGPLVPAPTFVVPTTNAGDYVASLGEGAGTAGVSGDYVGLAPLGGAAGSTGISPLTVGLSDGVVSVSIDAARLVEEFRPMIDMSLDQAVGLMAADAPELSESGFDVTAFAALYVDAARLMVDSIERVDLGVVQAGDELAVHGSMHFFPGTELAEFTSPTETGDASIAACVDGDAPMIFIGRVDPSVFTSKGKRLIEALVAAYPPGMEEVMRDTLSGYEAILPLCGNGYAGSGSFGSQGVSFAYYVEAPDPSALADKSADILAIFMPPDFGEATGPTERSIQGRRASEYRVEMNFDQMLDVWGALPQEQELAQDMEQIMSRIYGEDGLRLSFIEGSERLAITYGGSDDFIEEAAGRLDATDADLPRAMQAALASVRDSTLYIVYSFDIGRLMKDMADLMPPGSQMPSGGDWVATLYVGARGPVWHGGIFTDLSGMGRFMRSMQPR